MKTKILYPILIFICTGLFLLYLFLYENRVDNQAPTIYFSGEAPQVSTLDSEQALLQGVTAYDDVDGDVTDSVVVASIQLSDKDGSIHVTYAAFDSAGNVRKAVRQAQYTDYESPRFSLTHSLTFAYNSRFDIFDIVEAEDGLDGDISHRVRISSLDGTSISAEGLHQVELRVSNSLGETVMLTVPVEVYAAGTYDGTLTLTDYLIYLPANQAFDAESYLDSYTRSSITVSLRNGAPEGYSLEIKNNVQPDVPGVYTVEYRLSQTVGTGNNTKTYTGYAKLIVVVEG